MFVCVLLAAVVVPTVCLKVLLQVVTEQKEREWQPRDEQSTTESKLNGWGATSQRFQRPSNPSHRNRRAADFSRKVLFSSLLKRQSSEKKTAMTTTRSLSAPMGAHVPWPAQPTSLRPVIWGAPFRLRSEHPHPPWYAFPAVPDLLCGFLLGSWARLVTYHLLEDYRVLDGLYPWLNFDKGSVCIGGHPQLPAQASRWVFTWVCPNLTALGNCWGKRGCKENKSHLFSCPPTKKSLAEAAMCVFTLEQMHGGAYLCIKCGRVCGGQRPEQTRTTFGNNDGVCMWNLGYHEYSTENFRPWRQFLAQSEEETS